jgi:VWFA-related protein
MLWRVLKPNPGLADVPSVYKPPQRLGIATLVAVFAFGVLATQAPCNPVPPVLADDAKGSTATADSELLASSSPGGSVIQEWAIASLVAPAYTIRRIVPEVRLHFSVADELGRLVSDLRPADLRILDNLNAVNRIQEFSRLRDLPLQIGVLIDVSDSVGRTVVREKLAGTLFMRQVLRPDSDNAFLMAFGSNITLWQAATGDRAALIRALEHIQQDGSVTSLYDGLFDACRSQFSEQGEHGLSQRVLVLFSDGVDNGSFHALADAVAIAQHNDIQLYAVSVHPRRLPTRGDQVLLRAAEQTGGRFYIADSEKDFPAIFASMEQQMRTQYSVSFQPLEQTPGFHSVRLEISGPQKLQVRARQGYYFAAP